MISSPAPSLIRANAIDLPVNPSTIACIVTSPPYNAGIDYTPLDPSAPTPDDNLPWHLYRELAQKSAAEMFRVSIPGGRVWLNVAPIMPAGPLTHLDDQNARVPLLHLWTESLLLAGFLIRDYIVWKQDAHDGGTAWGSWCRPGAVNLRGEWETIVLAYKPIDGADGWKRPTPPQWKGWKDDRVGLGGDWAELTRNVWTIRPARRSEGAPAPFPIEIPLRAIRLSTWLDDVVLDPFAGSRTTGKAATMLGRESVMVDVGMDMR